MLTVFRWLLRLTIGLIVLAVLASLLTWYFAVRSLPDYDASYQVEGIGAPVEIVRSTEDVPHIFGETDADVFFALGLAHAQDRLFQMTMLRRAAQGRLAEVMGPQALPADDLARRLGLYRNAQASLQAQDAPTREALNAYAAGVNQWIGIVNDGAMGRGAPEFFLFPDVITYWTPTDSLAILKLIAAGATGAATDEIMRARLSLADPEHGPEILARPGLPVGLPAYASLFADARLSLPENRAGPESAPEAMGYLAPGPQLGGNAFGASPERTAADGTLLAVDLHGGLTAPSLYYLARLQLQNGGVIGATIPGMPVIFAGRSPTLSWALSPAAVDDSDIAIEEVQPGNPDRYRGVGGWTDFATRTETIRVLDDAPRSITLRETANGPVVPSLAPGLRDVTPIGHVPALRWTGLSRKDASMTALIGVMRAATTRDAQDALAHMTAPAMNAMLADRRGVTHLLAGAIPQRSDNHPTGGAMPSPGWLADGAWGGTTSLAGTPIEGRNGVGIATEEPGGNAMRQGRLTRLLQDREIHSRDSFIAAQLDVVSPAARTLLPLVGADLWFTEDPAAPGTPERQRQDALALMAEWDGAMSEHLPEPLIYSAWMAALQDRLIRDEIGPLADDLTRLQPGFIEAVFRNRGGASRWCDIVQSAATEDCTTIARQALDRAILDLSARFGPDVESWRWGDQHQARHVHPGLGRTPALGWIVNINQSVSGGDFTVARSGSVGHGDDPFLAGDGANFRGVFDLADPDSSVFITSTGQSGHPLSRHYDDLAGLWRRGEYVTMSLDPELARAAAAGITRLTPKG
ncbi:penicillin acylase family protein [Paracoccus sp. 1_MG-2023]|uniref:penicillin acylase family protein n=1 Tax=unclassified Paracoccus (in: a-proteobacteria) TaxID=2688777 RepID=UPI001C0A3540|nr:MULTISPECIES: penicillin acylase family protein [unclassified Paracoccus (in: a-proteobacteria)]MBU2958242.1 penicillin acylase family protein [Paracoccus sp. C2R09]MDO6668369.1 penicillin acylase family protein [Paracoccus sp. 1_MG-2023]